MKCPPSIGRQAAWTMVELLVAIAVLAVLAAILFPALGRARDEARAVGCLSNARAYGSALMAFIADNNQSLPDRTTPQLELENPMAYDLWVQPYLDRPLKELRCPNSNAEERKANGGFGYNGNGALTLYYPSLKGIPAPISRVVLATEMYTWFQGFWTGRHMNRTIWGNGNGSADPADEGTGYRPQYHGSPEKRGIHLFFLDGHVQRVSAHGNDWSQGPTLGDATNGGYFYESGQFSSMKRGKLSVQ